jgi:hypothetical protein
MALTAPRKASIRSVNSTRRKKRIEPMARKSDDFGPLSVKPRMRDGVVTSWYVDIRPHLSPTGRRTRPQFPDKSAASTEARAMLRSLSLDGAIRKHRVELSGFTFAEVSERWFAHQMERVDTAKKRKTHLKRMPIALRHCSSCSGI